MAGYSGARVLITGGLGFIGSNLAIRLADEGADLVLADALIPGYGGNTFNIEPARGRVRVNISDIRDRHGMNHLVREVDFIFHLAAQVSHILSVSDPFPDIDINIKGTAVLLEACKHHNPSVRLVYAGTRGQYGPVQKLPASEDAPMNPRGIYEMSHLTAETLCHLYHRIHGVRSVSLRLSNVYGPRAQMRHPHFGVANWFVRRVLDGDPIQVFGDGGQMRDFLFVSDCVEAFLSVGLCESAFGMDFNVGVPRPTTWLEYAQALLRVAGQGRWEYAPFSPERAAQEPGHYYSDISRIRSVVGWEPRVTLEEGLQKTLDYYRQYRSHYW